MSRRDDEDGTFAEACARNNPPARARALRFNAGKPELFYADMFPAALAGVSLVYTYGTNRPIKPYPRYNFMDGAPATELYACARRHMIRYFNGGEDFDPDAVAAGFQVHHLDSAIGNLMRLRQQIADGRKDLDDRPNTLRSTTTTTEEK